MFFSVLFLGTERLDDHDVYIIEIETLAHHTHWIIKKRYSEIRAFHMELQQASSQIELPTLPPKKLFKRQESVIEERKVKFTEYFQLLMSLTAEDLITRRKFENFLEIDNLNRYRENHDWVMIEYIKRIQEIDSGDLSQFLRTTGYDVINLTIESYDDDTSILQKCEAIHRQMKFTKCQFIFVNNVKDDRYSLFVPCFSDDTQKSPLVMYFNPYHPSDIDYVICMTFRHLGNLNCHIYFPETEISCEEEIKKFVKCLLEFGELSFLVSDIVLNAFGRYLDSQKVMKMSIAEFFWLIPKLCACDGIIMQDFNQPIFLNLTLVRCISRLSKFFQQRILGQCFFLYCFFSKKIFILQRKSI